MDTLAVQLYISHYLGMFRTFTCESAPMARKRNVRRKAHEKAGQRTAAPPILYAYSIARISSTSD